MNPRLHHPTQPTGSHGQTVEPQIHFVPLGATHLMPGLKRQSDPGQGMYVLTEKVTSITRSHK